MFSFWTAIHSPLTSSIFKTLNTIHEFTTQALTNYCFYFQLKNQTRGKREKPYAVAYRQTFRKALCFSGPTRNTKTDKCSIEVVFGVKFKKIIKRNTETHTIRRDRKTSSKSFK